MHGKKATALEIEARAKREDPSNIGWNRGVETKKKAATGKVTAGETKKHSTKEFLA